MIQKFSQTLRDKAKAYFEKRFSLTISDGEADEYLRSLDDLCFALGSHSPVTFGETRFPKETYRGTRISRVRVKVEAPKAHDLDAPAREMQAPDVPLS